MIKVVIIGGGFAGTAAARELRGNDPPVQCTLIDRRPTRDYPPLLPDILSGRVDPELLRSDFAALADEMDFSFLHAEVTSVDLKTKIVRCSTKAQGSSLKAQGGEAPPTESSPSLEPWTLSLSYDYLIIASGCAPSFHGREDLRVRSHVLADVASAVKLRDAAKRGDFDSVVIVGGSFTGIEVATSLRRVTSRPILIVEELEDLVSFAGPRVRAYVERNLRAMNIHFMVKTCVKELRGRDVELTDGRTASNALLVWAGGVRSAEFLRALDVRKGDQGLLVVDEFLRVNETCFVAGDSSRVVHRGRPVRMAVQVALDQGSCAGANVARLVRREPMRRYRPVDLGWIVPMANGRSVGRALGLPVRGRVATFLHYLMCVYRWTGAARRARIAAQLLWRS